MSREEGRPQGQALRERRSEEGGNAGRVEREADAWTNGRKDD